MHKKRKPIVISALSVALVAVSPILLAQNKQPDGPTARNSAGAAQGNILWQYNTDG